MKTLQAGAPLRQITCRKCFRNQNDREQKNCTSCGKLLDRNTTPLAVQVIPVKDPLLSQHQFERLVIGT